MRKLLLTLLCGSVFCAVAVCGAGNEGPAAPVGVLNVPSMPLDLDVRTAPLAAWIKPGARFTFEDVKGIHYFAYNQITPAKPGDTLNSFRDPNDPSRWLSIHTLRNTATIHLAEAVVVGVANGKVYCVQRVWEPGMSFRKWLRPVHAPPSLEFPVGRFGERYVSPELLKKIAEVDTPDSKIQRTTYAIQGKAVAALSFFTPASKSTAWYDLDTGLLIEGSSQFQDKQYDVVIAGQSSQGALVIDTCHLKTVRQLPYPWLGKPAPDWVAKAKSFTMKRKIFGTATPQPGGPLTVLEDQVTARIDDRGTDWIKVSVPALAPAGSPPAPNDITFSSAVVGPGSLFLPPTGLAELKVGQIIDTDPATGMVVTVTRFGREGNRDIVVFTEAGPDVTIYTKYNRTTGVLLDSQIDLVTTQANGVAGDSVTHIRRTITAVE